MRLILFVLLLAVSLRGYGQGSLSGTVVAPADDGSYTPLVGANVYSLPGLQGTTTDAEGRFALQPEPADTAVAVSYVGYRADTFLIRPGLDPLRIELRPAGTLEEVDVVYREKSTEVSLLDPQKVEKIGEKELLKAACCSLGESFETTPGVDVSFTDAVTGTRQIQLLGLAGPYTQITRESMPDVRGLATQYGLSFTPGTWIESMQLSKGTGSVANGYESIAGQINVELRKPDAGERLYLNLYGNEMGRLEANLHTRWALNENWSTGLLLHGDAMPFRHDRNDDGFLDNPRGRGFAGLNRWKYAGENGLRFQAGLKGTLLYRQGGQLDFRPDAHEGSTDLWGMELDVQRLEGWAKIGKVFAGQPWKSVGLQVSGSTYRQRSYYGLNRYDADQQSAYANLIYQSIIGNTNHSWRAGASLQYDRYAEDFNDAEYERTEWVPGAFFEYTYSYLEKLDVVAGLRADYHNLFGPFFTPRLHLRYAPAEQTVLRASAGRGQRTANILAENQGLMASARRFVIESEDADLPYGLDAEVAWNFGFNFTQKFRWNYRDGAVSLDLYHTRFRNQIVVDVDRSPQAVFFYNLAGRSFSNSLQVQLDYELLKRLDVRLAYRWLDVRTTFSGQLRPKPLVAPHRAFANLAYETRKHWAFDLTVNWQGRRRIPDTDSNPEAFQRPGRSPDFVLVNTQVSKSWRERWDVYVGAENLFNFRQTDPILAADQPFGPYFDSSLVWGPIFGRTVYVGMRLKLR